MTIGVLQMDLRIAGARSLKDKRRVLKSLKTLLHNRYNCSVAEIDFHDMWGRARLAACVVSNESRHANEELNEIAPFRVEQAWRGTAGLPDRDAVMRKQRTTRVAELIREEVARLLMKGVKDPRIGFVSIMAARVSPDLRYANIYVSMFGTESARKSSLVGLQQAARWMRGEVARNLKLRFAPELRFFPDETLDNVYHLEEVFKEIHAEDERLQSEVSPRVAREEAPEAQDKEADGHGGD